MKIIIEFDSKEEMHEWVIKEAGSAQSAMTGAWVAQEEPKPKRKRRTKAEMAAAQPADTHPPIEIPDYPEPPVPETEPDLTLVARFQQCMREDPTAATEELDRLGVPKFSKAGEDVQREILRVLEA